MSIIFILYRIIEHKLRKLLKTIRESTDIVNHISLLHRDILLSQNAINVFIYFILEYSTVTERNCMKY